MRIRVHSYSIRIAPPVVTGFLFPRPPPTKGRGKPAYKLAIVRLATPILKQFIELRILGVVFWKKACRKEDPPTNCWLKKIRPNSLTVRDVFKLFLQTRKSPYKLQKCDKDTFLCPAYKRERP